MLETMLNLFYAFIFVAGAVIATPGTFITAPLPALLYPMDRSRLVPIRPSPSSR